MKPASLLTLPLAAASTLLLSSCVIKDGGLDFTWWQDSAAPVMEDDVVIESGGGYYHSTPAPSRVPLASIPKEEPEKKVTPPAGHPAAEQPAAPGYYIVRPGDTLSAIARRYRTSVSALVAANGMASADVPLKVNQNLRIPGSAGTMAATRPAAPAGKPAVPTPASPAKPAAPAATGGTYLVKAGDTLYRISRQYGVSPTALMQANGLTPTSANTIRVGTTLRIPKAN